MPRFPDQTVVLTERELVVLSDVMRRLESLSGAHGEPSQWERAAWTIYAKTPEFRCALAKFHAAEQRCHAAAV